MTVRVKGSNLRVRAGEQLILVFPLSKRTLNILLIPSTRSWPTKSHKSASKMAFRQRERHGGKLLDEQIAYWGQGG